MVREFATLPCFPVDDDYFGGFQAFPQGSDGALEEVVLRPEAIYIGDDFRVVAIAMGNDTSGVARGAVVGMHGSFWGAAGLDIVLDKCSLFRGKLAVW